jgi:hypothetical protein
MKKDHGANTPPKIVFADIQAYLEAIANKATNDVDGGGCPHKRFWNVPFATFISGNVPLVLNAGHPIPIMDPTTPANSAFFAILKGPFVGKRQMPGGGPFITDTGYQVTTAAGKVVTGQQIQDDITWWLTHGFPEH